MNYSVVSSTVFRLRGQSCPWLTNLYRQSDPEGDLSGSPLVCLDL